MCISLANCADSASNGERACTEYGIYNEKMRSINFSLKKIPHFIIILNERTHTKLQHFFNMCMKIEISEGGIKYHSFGAGHKLHLINMLGSK